MSLVASIFCSSCKNVYDGTDRRPRVGTCSHTICEKCQSNRESSNCHICGLENAFSEKVYNYQLIGAFETFKQILTEENLENLKIVGNSFGNCFQCKSNEYLRICETCTVKVGLAEKLMGVILEWKTEKKEKKIHLLKSCIFCANCFEDNHPKDHIRIPLSHLSKLADEFAIPNIMVYGLILENKFESKSKQNVSETLETRIYEFRKQYIQYLVFLKVKKATNYIEKNIKLEGLLPNFTTLPQLAEAKEKSWQMAKAVKEKNLKLQERMLMYTKEDLNEFIESLSETKNSGDNQEDLDESITELISISKKFENLKIIDLSAEDIEEIDAKIEKKMKELEDAEREKNYSSVEADSKTFRYRGLKIEMQEIDRCLEQIEEMAKTEEAKRHHFVETSLKKIAELNEEINEGSQAGVSILTDAALKIFQFEIVDRSFILDKLILDFLEATHRKLQASLMALRFFWEDPELFSNLFCQDVKWIHDLFVASTTF